MLKGLLNQSCICVFVMHVNTYAQTRILLLFSPKSDLTKQFYGQKYSSCDLLVFKSIEDYIIECDFSLLKIVGCDLREMSCYF